MGEIVRQSLRSFSVTGPYRAVVPDLPAKYRDTELTVGERSDGSWHVGIVYPLTTEGLIALRDFLSSVIEEVDHA